jgi:imidazolonepropionase-like amidohydrolase
VERAVASVAAGGAVIVKVALNPPVGPVFSLDTLTAIVDAAHARGLRVTGHVHGLAELDKALDAGMDELAHMLTSSDRIPEATIRRMVDAGMVVVPTLSIFSGAALETAIANLSAFRAADGRTVYGTDLGNEGPRPGIDPNEVHAMARAGMSGLDIIRSATVDAASWLGLSTTGAIEAGRDADLVLVEGDPLTTPDALTNIRAVWRRGLRAR